MIRYTIMTNQIIDEVFRLLDIPQHMTAGVKTIEVRLARDHAVEFTIDGEALKSSADDGEEHF